MIKRTTFFFKYKIIFIVVFVIISVVLMSRVFMTGIDYWDNSYESIKKEDCVSGILYHSMNNHGMLHIRISPDKKLKLWNTGLNDVRFEKLIENGDSISKKSHSDTIFIFRKDNESLNFVITKYW